MTAILIILVMTVVLVVAKVAAQHRPGMTIGQAIDRASAEENRKRAGKGELYSNSISKWVGATIALSIPIGCVMYIFAQIF